ncbi:MAG: hypothetical protein H6728_12580 [Myxococcales bacterium]|nr:hypothetical protein [Myxococcales bacterium]
MYPRPQPLSPNKTDHLLVILSDIEMGAGGFTDDFPHTDFLAELIDEYSEDYSNNPVSLIFNGDTFDYLKVSIDGLYPHAVDEAVALAKTERIVATHDVFFAALSRFLQRDPQKRDIYFLLGNHDLEIVFPAVQEMLKDKIGDHQRVFFPGISLRIGDVHIEHGNQEDSLFRIDPEKPFVEYQGRDILNLPWGSVALLEAILPLHNELYHYDRLKPRDTVLSEIPQMKQLLTSVAWRYWLRDYWKGYWRGTDPLKKPTWGMIKEVFYRLRTKDTEISIRKAYQKRLREEDARVMVIGHEHQPHWQSFNDRKLLQTGCFRSEYMLHSNGEHEFIHVPLPKVYAEVWMREQSSIRSQLVEIEAPTPLAGFLPDSIFSIIPTLERLLGNDEHYEEEQAEWTAQEARESLDNLPSLDATLESDKKKN